MATNSKDFKVKNNLVVEGSQVTLGTTPIAFNTSTNKLEIFINGSWEPIAFTSEIPDVAEITFMDLGLAIDFDGSPVYTVQANGVENTSTKFGDGGDPSSSSFALTFDSGNIA